jgi:EpsD family peptidyl-prolyl cis-trans isomerase
MGTVLPRISFGALLIAVLFAAGCGDAKKPPATQVAARVNSQEITVHQVNSILARTPNVDAAAAPAVKRQVLDRLIDQQLAVQQALHKKLDRTPSVQQALEAARSDILSRAYLEQIALTTVKPNAEDVKKYYAEHPELFAQRRVYSLEEITVAAPEASVVAELRQRAAKARSLKEVADWLQSKNARFAPSRGVRAAEQIPLELLPKLQAAKDGENVFVEHKDGVQVFRILASKLEPVDEAQATPRIEQFLTNRRTTEAIANDLKQLKAGAEIEYQGEFAAASTDEATAKAVQAAKARAEAEAKEKAQAEAQARAEETTKARVALEAKARLEAEAAERSAAGKPAPLPQDSIKKGVGVR